MRLSFTPKNLLLSLCLLTTAALAAPTKNETQEYVLENGLKLIVKVDDRSPTVVNMIWYKAGSIDESYGTTGVAHALEHMMFKSTTTLKVGEFSKIIAKLGGTENAFTNNDYTAYYQKIDKKYLTNVLALEADRMHNLTLSEEEFKKEIKVIMEERRWRTDDKPQAKTYEALMATAYHASPLHHPVIGWMNDLENMTYKDAQTWYHRWYTPNNAVIVIVGDIEPEATYQHVKKLFGSLKPQALPERKPQHEPSQIGVRRITVKAPAEQAYMIMGYKVPRLESIEKNDDVYALVVLSTILSGYDGARLQKKLIQSNQLATATDSSYDFISRQDPLFMIDATAASGKRNKNGIRKHCKKRHF
jgi:zinc protease